MSIRYLQRGEHEKKKIVLTRMIMFLLVFIAMYIHSLKKKIQIGCSSSMKILNLFVLLPAIYLCSERG